MLTGIGGGMTRDVLAGNVPFVLRGDLYAIAALASGAIVSIGSVLGIPPLYPMLLPSASSFGLWRSIVAGALPSPAGATVFEKMGG